MKGLQASLRANRRTLGFSQAALAKATGVSLATIQNLEAGRANPSLATIEPVLREVGLMAEWRAVEPDWDRLAALGLPLSARRIARMRRTRERLLQELGPALVAAAEERLDGRQADALRALLLALEIHFPEVWSGRLAHSAVARRLVAMPADGRTIKLYRIARATLAEYM